jgi:hypothetical protein
MIAVVDDDQLDDDQLDDDRSDGRTSHQLVATDLPAVERAGRTHTPAWRGWTEAHRARRRVPSPRSAVARALGGAYVSSRGDAS